MDLFKSVARIMARRNIELPTDRPEPMARQTSGQRWPKGGIRLHVTTFNYERKDGAVVRHGMLINLGRNYVGPRNADLRPLGRAATRRRRQNAAIVEKALMEAAS